MFVCGGESACTPETASAAAVTCGDRVDMGSDLRFRRSSPSVNFRDFSRSRGLFADWPRTEASGRGSCRAPRRVIACRAMTDDKRDAAVERLLDQRLEQGLERTVTDPAAIARIAAIIREDR